MKKTIAPLSLLALLAAGLTYKLYGATTPTPPASPTAVYSSAEAHRHFHGQATHWRSMLMQP